MKVLAAAMAGTTALALVACGGSGGRNPFGGMLVSYQPMQNEIETNIRLMLSFDSNRDGTVTREEMETVLAEQFRAADSDHDGRLNNAEIQEENDRRWRAMGTGFSPLIDWNQDGIVDMTEFASTARSVFEQLDRNRDGMLSPDELRPPRRVRGPTASNTPRRSR